MWAANRVNHLDLFVHKWTSVGRTWLSQSLWTPCSKTIKTWRLVVYFTFVCVGNVHLQQYAVEAIFRKELSRLGLTNLQPVSFFFVIANMFDYHAFIWSQYFQRSKKKWNPDSELLYKMIQIELRSDFFSPIVFLNCSNSLLMVLLSLSKAAWRAMSLFIVSYVHYHLLFSLIKSISTECQPRSTCLR